MMIIYNFKKTDSYLRDRFLTKAYLKSHQKLLPIEVESLLKSWWQKKIVRIASAFLQLIKINSFLKQFILIKMIVFISVEKKFNQKFIPIIKKASYYPIIKNAPKSTLLLLEIEHFLAPKRNVWQKFQYHLIKQIEINAIMSSDHIVFSSQREKNLLSNDLYLPKNHYSIYTNAEKDRSKIQLKQYLDESTGPYKAF